MNKFISALFFLVATALAKPNDGITKSIMDMRLMYPNQFDGRIVGGEEAEPNAFPYQLSLRSGGLLSYHFCGASIYDEKTAITAAHCCQNLPKYAKVVAGDHSQHSVSGFEQKIRVKSYVIHPDFGTSGVNNDICILHLENPLELNDKVAKIAMPDQDQEFEGEAVISGWGTTFSGAPPSFLLRWAKVNIVSKAECQNAYGSRIDDSMICAAAPGKDSCQGDSGGPMVCDGVQCGIVSWGYGCADPKYPGVYAKLSKFMDWVKENV
uniref:Intestinal trypsin 3 n=1 Tax=Lepeophtheirus salmonis TaxID=72036 RepID=Q6QX61_LEPSM|nr:intestinal trypsin 3 precursor [Lepeophtheirus salmonis]CAH61270.1 putative trypsin [Lepeophtheirus salmonis]